MSAFIVKRNHIRYLVEAALHFAASQSNSRFVWFHQEELQVLTWDNADTVGQMLWDECIASVRYRYGDSSAPLPGPVGEDFTYHHQPAPAGFVFDPVQVLAAVDCYTFQSCEHPGWVGSAPWGFATQLIHVAVTKVPGYSETLWGAPEIGPPPRTWLQARAMSLGSHPIAEGPAALARNLVLRTDGFWEDRPPADTKGYTLEELQGSIGGGSIEACELADGRIMVLDEDGRRKELPFNSAATTLYQVGRDGGGGDILGDVLVCESWLVD